MPKELSDSLYPPFFSQILKVFTLFQHVYKTGENKNEVFRALEPLRVSGKGRKVKELERQTRRHGVRKRKNIFLLVRMNEMEGETLNKQDQMRKEMFLNNYPFPHGNVSLQSVVKIH